MRVDVSDQDEKISVGRQARVGKMVRRAGKACLIAKDPASLRTGLAIPGSHTLLFRQAYLPGWRQCVLLRKGATNPDNDD